MAAAPRTWLAFAVSLTLRLYTDFVCPFCFIAEQASVPKLLTEFDLSLDWHGFELHPETPPGGMPLSELFPGVSLPSCHARPRRFAAPFGVPGLNPPDRLQNTRKALAAAEFARDAGKLEPFRQQAMDAHWRRGADLEAATDLRAIATAAGVDADAAITASQDAALLARVDEKQNEAKHNGVRGIPTFLFGSERVVGCQPYEALAAAALRAGATRR
jgi:predicted DsbA family dithiol-disulfide isomerase